MNNRFHHQWVFNIPRRLRIYFPKLPVCDWNVIKRHLQSSVADKDAVPDWAIFQSIDNLFMICYTLSGKKKVPIPYP